MNLSKTEKKTLIIWAIAAIIIFSLFVVLSIYSEKKNDAKFSESQIVTDYGRYYTVVNAINKFYSFVNSENSTSVLNILEEKYKSENSLNKNNVLTLFKESQKKLAYETIMMCEQKNNNGNAIYYVKGSLKEDNTGEILKNKYFTVILDNNKFIYSLYPINEKKFKGECHE